MSHPQKFKGTKVPSLFLNLNRICPCRSAHVTSTPPLVPVHCAHHARNKHTHTPHHAPRTIQTHTDTHLHSHSQPPHRSAARCSANDSHQFTSNSRLQASASFPHPPLFYRPASNPYPISPNQAEHLPRQPVLPPECYRLICGLRSLSEICGPRILRSWKTPQ